MLGAITSLLAKPRTLHADLKLHHIEPGDDQLIIGVEVTWRNDILHPLHIQGIYLELFHKGPAQDPVTFTYLERFACIPYQKTITKIDGANSFPIQAGSTRSEHLRFLTRKIPDLTDGRYEVELHSSVAEGTYVHYFSVKVVPQLKIHAPGSEAANAQAAGFETSFLARARKIAPK